MSWPTALSDLRNILSDGATDKYFSRKKCFGEINGTNVSFKTFEFRRINNFTSSSAPIGVYVDGVLATVSSDNPDSGDFVLSSAPAARASVEASYYAQWFLDTELQIFLRTSSNWLSFGDTYSNIGVGFVPSALKYAQAEAYDKLALRWSNLLSEMYLLNDAPKEKTKSPVDMYMRLADQCRKAAYEARDDFYKRSGQSNAPLFGTAGGMATDPVPVR